MSSAADALREAGSDDPTVLAGEPADTRTVLERLAEQREAANAQTLECRCPIPSWGGEAGDLVGVFRKPGKSRRSQYEQMVKVRPAIKGEEAKAITRLCDDVALYCHQLVWNDEEIPAGPMSGFSEEFGAACQPDPAKPASWSTTGQVQPGDVVWAAVGRDQEALAALWREVVMKWARNPRPLDLTDSDPFGRP